MGLIPEEIIAQVLDRSDIVETIGSYIPLKRAGRNFKALCPFHNEKTPSFVVGADKQIYHCFGCGAGGNVISFVMKYERLEFPEAVETLARQAGIVIPQNEKAGPGVDGRQTFFEINNLAAQFYHTHLFSGTDSAAKSARSYLKGRQITPETARDCQLGFAPHSWDGLMNHLRGKGIALSLMEKAGLIISRDNREGFYDRFRHRIMFPIFDTRSRCLGFGARAMEESDGAKYINSPETPIYIKGHHLYGLNQAKESIREMDVVIVVEGYMDFLIPWQSGVRNIVASLGTALTNDQIRHLRRFTQNVIMLFDSDKAGEEATLRSLELLIEESMNVKVATLERGEDPDSFVRKRGVEKFKEQIAQAMPLFEYKLKMLMGRYDHKTVEGQAQICKLILPTIRKFNNAVVRFGYVKQLAHTLSVAEEALLIELKKHAPVEESAAEPSAKAAEADPWDSVHVAERNLLQLMLEENGHISFVREELGLSDFRDDRIRDVVAHVFDLSEKGAAIQPALLVNVFPDAKINRMIAQMLVSDMSLAGDQERLRRDYIDRIKRDRLKSERQDLSRQIRAAELQGDWVKLNDLKERFNQLIKR